MPIHRVWPRNLHHHLAGMAGGNTIDEGQV